MELVMKNNMMQVEQVELSRTTASGLHIPETAVAEFQNQLPYRVVAVEQDNPVGIEVGDYVYIRPNGTHFTGRLENEKAMFTDVFSVLAVSKSFDVEKHAQVDYKTSIITE